MYKKEIWKRIYTIWAWIKTRCNNKKHNTYKNYWGRWITYDSRWEKFENFYDDMKEWYQDDLTIDRKDSDWNYTKDNCRWANNTTQHNNKRNNKFIKWKTIAEWSRELWEPIHILRGKIKKWIPIDYKLKSDLKYTFKLPNWSIIET